VLFFEISQKQEIFQCKKIIYIYYHWLNLFSETVPKKTGDFSMKTLTLFTICIAFCCVLAAGCVIQPKKDPGNGTAPPTTTFTSFVNATPVSGSNATINGTNVTNTTSKLKGPLRVSISGYPADLEVIINNQSAGTVTKEKPLDLMLNEGKYNVSVCANTICENETVNIIFARKTYVDFGDRLKKDVEFPLPTARKLEYFRNGNGVSVSVEFINPSTKPLRISTEISVGYSYIDSRTNIRMGDSVRSLASEYVEPGRRVSRTVDLYFADGSAYSFDEPKIGQITYQ
jgi:hypothetical protein